MSDTADAVPAERARIWDGPTRLFHWAIVLLIPAMWWTAENEQIALHVTLGLAMFALVLFRVIWGVIGSRTARFAGFVKGPGAIVRYFREGSPHSHGHNPLGGLSVIAMIAVLAAQVGLGLFAEDNDGLVAGPLSSWVSADTAERLTDLHEWLFNVLLALIALHLAAILYYAAAKRRNLIAPMITGNGSVPAGTSPMRTPSLLRITLVAAICGVLTFWLWSRL